MKIRKRLRLLWTFQQHTFFIAMLMSLVCGYLLNEYGLQILTYLLCFKLFTMAAFFFYINSYKKAEFFYYQNLGFSRKFLWVYTLSTDFILFIAILTILCK